MQIQEQICYTFEYIEHNFVKCLVGKIRHLRLIQIILWHKVLNPKEAAKGGGKARTSP